MKERVYHMPLGGMNEVGDRNCHAIVYVDKHGHKEAVLFDCGQKVPLDAPEDQELGPEYFPDFSQLFAQDIHIRAVLVSHAPLDHVGALPYLCELINGQRSGEGAPLIVCSDFAKDVIYNIVFRGYCGAKFTSRKRLRIGPFDIEMFPVIHSTPGSRGFSVRVGGEHTVYLGDCKLANHIPETQGEEDEFSRRLALLGHERPDALLLDSTNSDKYISTGFERDVRTAIRADMIKNADVRLFMVTFASHIDRLGDTLRCAEQMGRPVFVRASNMSKYLRIAGMKSWRWYGEDPNTHTFPNVPKNAIMLLSGAQAEPNSALVRFMKGSLPMPVDETRDALMFACSTIPGETTTCHPGARRARASRGGGFAHTPHKLAVCGGRRGGDRSLVYETKKVKEKEKSRFAMRNGF